VLTVKETAVVARVSEALVYAWIAAGVLAHHRMGRPGRRGTIRIAEADLEAFLAAQRRQKPEEPAMPAQRRKVVLHHLTMPSS
jgi:excisionase family DNA binding protein